MIMKIMRMCQGELLVSWVSGLDRVEELPWMEEVVSLTVMITMMAMITMITMMAMITMILLKLRFVQLNHRRESATAFNQALACDC